MNEKTDRGFRALFLIFAMAGMNESCHFSPPIVVPAMVSISASVQADSTTSQSSDSIEVSIRANDWTGMPAQCWIYCDAPDGKRYYFKDGSWSFDAPLFTVITLRDIQHFVVYKNPQAAFGDYAFRFVIDTDPNGQIENRRAADSVSFNIPSNGWVKFIINGTPGDRTIAPNTPLSVDLQLNVNNWAGVPCDWWIYCDAPEGRYYYNVSDGWRLGEQRVANKGQAHDILTPYRLLDAPNGLPAGIYSFHAILDNKENGVLDGWQIEQSVVVTVDES